MTNNLPWFRMYSEILTDRKITRIRAKIGQDSALVEWAIFINKAVRDGATNTGPNLTTITYTEAMMADKNISPSEEFGNLSQSDLSALIDLLRSQEEYHRDELIRLKQLRKRAESLIPDDYNHLWQQIDDLLEAYDDDPDRLPTDPV